MALHSKVSTHWSATRLTINSWCWGSARSLSSILTILYSSFLSHYLSALSLSLDLLLGFPEFFFYSFLYFSFSRFLCGFFLRWLCDLYQRHALALPSALLLCFTQYSRPACPNYSLVYHAPYCFCVSIACCRWRCRQQRSCWGIVVVVVVALSQHKSMSVEHSQFYSSDLPIYSPLRPAAGRRPLIVVFICVCLLCIANFICIQ